MSDYSNKVWVEKNNDMPYPYARVEVHYWDEDGTRISESCAELSGNKADPDVHDKLESECRADIRRRVGLKELPDE